MFSQRRDLILKIPTESSSMPPPAVRGYDRALNPHWASQIDGVERAHRVNCSARSWHGQCDPEHDREFGQLRTDRLPGLSGHSQLENHGKGSIVAPKELLKPLL
jgi:hypothetical protein